MTAFVSRITSVYYVVQCTVQYQITPDARYTSIVILCSFLAQFLFYSLFLLSLPIGALFVFRTTDTRLIFYCEFLCTQETHGRTRERRSGRESEADADALNSLWRHNYATQKLKKMAYSVQHTASRRVLVAASRLLDTSRHSSKTTRLENYCTVEHYCTVRQRGNGQRVNNRYRTFFQILRTQIFTGNKTNNTNENPNPGVGALFFVRRRKRGKQRT